MSSKLWQGAFEGASGDVTAFNSAENVQLDQRLVPYDILGSIAHVRMLAKQKIISSKEADEISQALGVVLDTHKKGQFALDPALEDVHSNVENAVTAITPLGKKMHTARSRNDQVLLDMRLYLRGETLATAHLILTLQKAFAKLAQADGPMVGYTHTRVAQPITISLWCDAQAKSLDRDLARLMEAHARFNINPLGSGAIAASGWPVDRAYTAKLLAFDGVQTNPLDTTSSRGEEEAELLSHLSLLMAKLSGLSEELIWLSQMRLVRIPDAFCTGSSMMPNKKNPDVLELVRGRAGRVSGSLVHVLTSKKGLISGYHSDLQETKFAVMMGLDTAKSCVAILAQLVPLIEFDPAAIAAELEGGYASATEVADALARKGVPFREAHGQVGKLVGECQARGIPLSQAPPLAPLDAKEWAEATALARPRLKTAVALDPKAEKFVEAERARIAACFAALSPAAGR